MAEKRGLGSGLNALFGASEPLEGGVKTLPISKVEPREDQPRSNFDQVALQELSESIKQYGLIQPITVRRIDGGYYQIIAGERRWRASRLAGLTQIPVNIIEADDRKAMELALVENLQREDLNPIEEARGYRSLMDDYGMTQEEASSAVGKSRSAVANSLRLLSLCPAVMELLEKGELSSGHARALLAIRSDALQLEAAQAVIDRRLSVRQTEALAARLSKTPQADGKKDEIVVDYVREVERELENAMGRKVKLLDGRKRGHIEIEFYGADDREKLIEELKLFSSLRRKK